MKIIIEARGMLYRKSHKKDHNDQLMIKRANQGQEVLS